MSGLEKRKNPQDQGPSSSSGAEKKGTSDEVESPDEGKGRPGSSVKAAGIGGKGKKQPRSKSAPAESTPLVKNIVRHALVRKHCIKCGDPFTKELKTHVPLCTGMKKTEASPKK